MRKPLRYMALAALMVGGCSKDAQEGAQATRDSQRADLHAHQSAQLMTNADVAGEGGMHQRHGATSVAHMVSAFDRALAALKALQEGRTPADSDMTVLLEMARQPDQLLPYVHDAVYVVPREGLLAREQERHDKVIWLCTNVALACTDPEACNELLHTAGSAAERRAKLTPSSTPDERAERQRYWDVAKELYQMVIQRAEAGIAVREAADSALFLGHILAQEGRTAEAEAAYRVFMRFSDEFERQPSNVEFGAMKIAMLTFRSNPQRTERLLREILDKNPRTIHREAIERHLKRLQKAESTTTPTD